MGLLIKLFIIFQLIIKETDGAVLWNLDTSDTGIYGTRIGGSVRLNCTLTGSTCCPNTDTRRWSIANGGPFSPIVTNGISIDTSKYEEDLQIASSQFNLIIKDFDVADVNIEYQCQYKFFTDANTLQMSDGLQYIPTTNDISVISSSFDQINSFSYSVNITSVYPEPNCSCVFDGDDLTSEMTTTVGDNGALKYAVLRLSNVSHECSGEFRITCSIGPNDNQLIVSSTPCATTEPSSSSAVTTQQTHTPTRSTKWTIKTIIIEVVIPIACAIVIIVLIVLIVCCLRKKKDKVNGNESSILNTELHLNGKGENEHIDEANATLRCSHNLGNQANNIGHITSEK